MTPAPEQVAQWLREIDCVQEVAMKVFSTVELTQDQLQRLVTRAMAEQAEADAKLCDSLEYEFRSGANCAAAIRANAPKVNT